MDLRRIKNVEVKTALKARRQMDQTQWGLGKSISKELDPQNKQELLPVIESQRAVPDVEKAVRKDRVTAIYSNLFDENQKIRGGLVRKAPYKSLSEITEVIRDE